MVSYFTKKLLFLAAGAILLPCLAFAGEYYYQDYEVEIFVNQDSTLNVEEKQTYHLDGNFGYFFRDIERKKLDHFSDIEILDSQGKTIPRNQTEISWNDNRQHLQWNFTRQDFSGESKSWLIKYKVSGGLDFYDDHDELYWNTIPDDRQVVIENLKVVVHLPGAVDLQAISVSAYPPRIKSSYYFLDNQTLVFNAEDIAPFENFTIAVGWPKGIIKRPLFYREQAINWFFAGAAVLAPVISFIFLFKRWQEKGREPKVDKAIMALYEPPEGLKPAVVEVLMRQDVDKGIGATIIDLARRGYLKIEEQPQKFLGLRFSKDYTIKKTIEAENEEDSLSPFEKRVLFFLFPGGRSNFLSAAENLVFPLLFPKDKT